VHVHADTGSGFQFLDASDRELCIVAILTINTVTVKSESIFYHTNLSHHFHVLEIKLVLDLDDNILCT
jgi:hypothetical protein